MTPKEYLKQIAKYDYKIYRLDDEILTLRAKLGAKGISYDKVKVQSSPTDQTDLIAKMIDMEAKADELRVEALELREKIISQINDMEDPIDAEFLYLRYVKCLNLELIARKIGYTYEYAGQKHGIALQKFEAQYGPF